MKKLCAVCHQSRHIHYPHKDCFSCRINTKGRDLYRSERDFGILIGEIAAGKINDARGR